MAKGRRTRSEKEKAVYRWEKAETKTRVVEEKREVAEFGYLSKNYIRKDLLKSVVASLVIIAVEIYLSRVL